MAEGGRSSSSEEERMSDQRTEDDDLELFTTLFRPYENEPLASNSDESSSDQNQDEELDEDGLAPLTLERRFLKIDPVQSWCKCNNHCNDETLATAREYRCCKEIPWAVGLLAFDGSVERVSCITEHEDYSALTNETVLKLIAYLFKDKAGRRYRRQNGGSEKEFLRATAYRLLIRWICGYRGWDNARPLPACIYHSIRTKFVSHNVTGYSASLERA